MTGDDERESNRAFDHPNERARGQARRPVDCSGCGARVGPVSVRASGTGPYAVPAAEAAALSMEMSVSGLTCSPTERRARRSAQRRRRCVYERGVDVGVGAGGGLDGGHD
jgi:hypothetical protein